MISNILYEFFMPILCVLGPLCAYAALMNYVWHRARRPNPPRWVRFAEKVRKALAMES